MRRQLLECGSNKAPTFDLSYSVFTTTLLVCLRLSHFSEQECKAMARSVPAAGHSKLRRHYPPHHINQVRCTALYGSVKQLLVRYTS
jgi:hypothetical protein